MSYSKYNIESKKSKEGFVTGGHFKGVGLDIKWQDGELFTKAGKPKKQNGAFIEDVLMGLKQRFEAFQDSPSKCHENQRILRHLNLALVEVNRRRVNRKARGVQGKHEA